MSISMTKTDFISNVRLNSFVQTLASQLELNAPLTFLNRTPMVTVLDEAEILSSFSGPIFAADLITDDAEAVVVEGGRLETTATVSTIPNIKIGASVGQGMLSRLSQLQRGIELDGPSDLITGWELNLAQNLVTGVRQRQNQLCAAMMLDGVTYDRMGFKISTGFGTPSTLKQTLVGNRTWETANVTTMKPIEDLQYMTQSVAPSLGKSYDRVTMATTTFQLIIASDEFAERVRLLLRLDSSQFSINTYDIVNMQNLFTAVTGLKLELEDTTFRVRNSDGSSTSTRVLPSNKVLLSNTGDDNNQSAYKLANTIVDESIIAPLAQNGPNFGGGPQVGPLSYYWIDPSLNPPRLNAFAVAKSWPMKVDKYSTAIITAFA